MQPGVSLCNICENKHVRCEVNIIYKPVIAKKKLCKTISNCELKKELVDLGTIYVPNCTPAHVQKIYALNVLAKLFHFECVAAILCNDILQLALSIWMNSLWAMVNDMSQDTQSMRAE